MLTVQNTNKFDWASIPLSDCCEGNAADAYFTLKLFDLVSEKLEELKVMHFVEQVITPSLSTFAEMEFEGMLVSKERLQRLGKDLSDLTLDQEDALYRFGEVSKTDNLSSNNDLIDLLYTRVGGFELYPPDKTATGKPSVSAPTLKLLLEQINKELTKRR